MSLSPCTEEGVKLIKLKLKTQSATVEILVKIYKLRDIEECKQKYLLKRE